MEKERKLGYEGKTRNIRGWKRRVVFNIMIIVISFNIKVSYGICLM